MAEGTLEKVNAEREVPVDDRAKLLDHVATQLARGVEQDTAVKATLDNWELQDKLRAEAEAETAVDRESPATPEGHREEDAGGNRS